MIPTKIYTVNRKEASFFFALLALGWGYAVIVHPGPQNFFIVGFLFLMFVALAGGFLWGTYAKLDSAKRTFTRIDYFFFKKQLHLDEIEEIKYQPTWKMGSANRSLYIIGNRHGQWRIINFPNLGFSPGTIATIAQDLKAAIPDLKVDDFAEALIKKYQEEKYGENGRNGDGHD